VAGGQRLLAAFGMLTRISIKVRLAWSTVAQMGFLVLECGLGLYHMAALHLIGHSLYKAHHFLAASDVVARRASRCWARRRRWRAAACWLAPRWLALRCCWCCSCRGRLAVVVDGGAGPGLGTAAVAAAAAGEPTPGACGGLGHRAGLGAGPDAGGPGSATSCRWG
jgi:hypothetical protein